MTLRSRGAQVGPYRLEAPLGRGGMGEVWRATGPAGPVALKLLLLHDGPAAARFLREAQLGATLGHPNLVEVRDVGEHQGCPYLAMELVDGTTLGHLLANGQRLAPNLLLDVGRQLAAGLDTLHQADLVHRDVKPANVMVTRRGVVKLADLGLVGGVALDTLTRTGTVVGTPRFMAPEQVQHGITSSATDLFAMGLLLYLAMTGRDPFDRTPETPLGEVLQRLITQDPRPWYPARAGGPLDRAFRAALAREPTARPASASALVEALAEAIERERTGDVDDPSTELLTIDSTDTLELAAAQAPQLPREARLPAEAPGAPMGAPPEARPTRPLAWLGLGLVGALVGAMAWPAGEVPEVTAWSVVQGNTGAALVFHTERPVALAAGPDEAGTAHVVPWGEAGIPPRTRAGEALFDAPPSATPEEVGAGELAYEAAGGIRLSFRRPPLGMLRIEGGAQVWRPLSLASGDAERLVFHLPGGDLPGPLSLLLEAGGHAVELARLVPPPPAEDAREAALERLAAWDPRGHLEPAADGQVEVSIQRILRDATFQAYLQIEENLVHELERRPNYAPPGLDRALLVDAFLHYAKVDSPVRLARSRARFRVWREGFWAPRIPRYPGLVVYDGNSRVFTYDFGGAAASTRDPIGMLEGHFGTRPLLAPELPPGPSWLEVYGNRWLGTTFAALWVNDRGPFFLTEQPRANPQRDLEAYLARFGALAAPDHRHRTMQLRLPPGVVRADEADAKAEASRNHLRIELRTWARPSDIINPWVFLHGFGVRAADAVPMPVEALEATER